jgi:hypothetical protein
MPRKYKLLSGVEFTIPPAPIDDRAEPLLAMIYNRAEPPPEKAAAERYLRERVRAILQVCCPEVYPKVTLADIPALGERMGEMLSDAWGEPEVIGGGADPKKPCAPGGGCNGAAPGSEATGASPKA